MKFRMSFQSSILSERRVKKKKEREREMFVLKRVGECKVKRERDEGKRNGLYRIKTNMRRGQRNKTGHTLFAVLDKLNISNHIRFLEKHNEQVTEPTGR